MQLVKYRDLGTMEYDFAWKLQQSIFDDIVAKKLKNRTLMPDDQLNYQHHLLFVEHDPVITMGKNADEKNLLLNEDFLKQKGVQLFHINRGGDTVFNVHILIFINIIRGELPLFFFTYLLFWFCRA